MDILGWSLHMLQQFLDGVNIVVGQLNALIRACMVAELVSPSVLLHTSTRANSPTLPR